VAPEGHWNDGKWSCRASELQVLDVGSNELGRGGNGCNVEGGFLVNSSDDSQGEFRKLSSSLSVVSNKSRCLGPRCHSWWSYLLQSLWLLR